MSETKTMMQIIYETLKTAAQNDVRVNGLVLNPRDYRKLCTELGIEITRYDLGTIKYSGPVREVEIFRDVYD